MASNTITTALQNLALKDGYPYGTGLAAISPWRQAPAYWWSITGETGGCLQPFIQHCGIIVTNRQRLRADYIQR
jgi:hypothetical protein